LPRDPKPMHALWPWRLHHARPHRRFRRGVTHYHCLCRGLWFRLTQRTRWGIALTGRFSRGATPLSGHAPTTSLEYPSMAIKKRENRTKDLKHLAAMETVILSDRLALVEHCALMQYEDGTPRLPGWVTVKTQGAAWIVQVKDPDSCSSFSAVAPTLDGAIDTACLLLACDDAPWEADKWLADAASRAKRK